MFEPKYEGEIAGWVTNYLRANHWRVESTVPWDDCQQEAYVVFLRLKRKYIHVTEPSHFMALFKTTWFNTFTDLANENTLQRAVTSLNNFTIEGDTGAAEYAVEVAASHPIDSAIGSTDNDGYLATLIRQAPREVTMVLNLFLSAPQELLDVALTGWVNGDKRSKSGGSSKVNRLLGLPEDQDTMKTVAEYFRD